MLDFDVSYYEKEERDGFVIPSLMKHAWASQLELLAKVDKICSDNDIKYYANWGTLLGAVRHKGFIPWDDDLDLCMKRRDLERFADVVSNYDGILISTAYNSFNHGFHACRVSNSEMFMVSRRQYKDYHGFPFPVGLDIFNLDYVPRDKALEDELVEAVKVCATAAHNREWLNSHDANEREYNEIFREYEEALNWLKINCSVEFSVDYPDYQELVILHEEIAGLYSADDADYITEIQCLAGGANYYIPKEIYDDTIRLPFENTTIPVPVGYNYILKTKYGDSYMVPKNVAAGHDYPFYDTFIKAIYDKNKHKTLDGAKEYVQDISSRYYINFINKKSTPTLSVNNDVIRTLESRGIDKADISLILAKCELLEEFKRICTIIGIDYYAVNHTLDEALDGRLDDAYYGALEVAIKRDDVSAFLSALGTNLSPWFDYSNLYSNDEHEDMRIIIHSDKYMCDDIEYQERFHKALSEVSLYISIIDYVAADEEAESARAALIGSLVATANAMPNRGPYSEDILKITDEWNNILDIEINPDMNLKREYLCAADYMSSSANREKAIRCRLNSSYQDKSDITYPISYYEKSIDVDYYITKISVPCGE